MGLVPMFEANLVQVSTEGEGQEQKRAVTEVRVSRIYTGPNPLRAMVQSKARGNATNAVQIAGIIGQQTFSDGRIPRSLPSGSIRVTTPDDAQGGARAPGPRFVNRGNRSLPCYPFGDNTPKSRGFIPKSYLQGKSPSEDFLSHEASRQNLTSNTDLTPRTGYFERRVKTFTENLRISRVNGKFVVANERGLIVMYDYLVDPTRTFRIQGKTTFIDVAHERRTMKNLFSEEAVVINIPFLPTLASYVPYIERMNTTISQYLDRDVILICDPKIETEYEDLYTYLRNIVPKQTFHPNMVVITALASLSSTQREYMYAAFDQYQKVTVYPFSKRSVSDAVTQAIACPLPQGASAAIHITDAPIDGISYKVRSGDIIPLTTLYQMLTQGTSFTAYPFIVRPNNNLFTLLGGHPLLEALILSGNLVSL